MLKKTKVFKKFTIFYVLLLSTSWNSEAQVWEIVREGLHRSVYGQGGRTYAAYQGNLVVSDDHVNWTEIETPAEIDHPIPIFFDHQNGVLLTHFDGSSDNEHFARTSDGGATWELFLPDLDGATSFLPQQFRRVDDQTIIGRVSTSVYVSNDRGASWMRKSTQGIHTDVSAIEAFGQDLWYISSNRSGMYRSTDQGDTWEDMNLPPIENFTMFTADLGYAISASLNDPNNEVHLFKTTDGWETYESFTYVKPEDEWIYVFHVTDDEGFGLFVGDRFYYDKDIYDPAQGLQLVQEFEGLGATGNFRINDAWYQRNSFDLIKLNAEIEATPIVITSIDGEEVNDLSVFPNPAEDYVEVNLEGYEQYELTDLSGALVKRGNLEAQRIYLRQVVRGIYLLKLVDRQALLPEKMVRLKKK